MEDTPNLHNFLYPERDHTWTKEEFIAYEEAVDAWNWEKFRREASVKVLQGAIGNARNMDEIKVGDLIDIVLNITDTLIDKLKEK